MRLVLILGCAALASAVFGCSSNPAMEVAGPTSVSDANRPPSGTGDFKWEDEFIGPPIKTELDAQPSPQAADPVAARSAAAPAEDPINENIIGPPIRTELDTRPSNQTSSANGPTVAP